MLALPSSKTFLTSPRTITCQLVPNVVLIITISPHNVLFSLTCFTALKRAYFTLFGVDTTASFWSVNARYIVRCDGWCLKLRIPVSDLPHIAQTHLRATLFTHRDHLGNSWTTENRYQWFQLGTLAQWKVPARFNVWGKVRYGALVRFSIHSVRYGVKKGSITNTVEN